MTLIAQQNHQQISGVLDSIGSKLSSSEGSRKRGEISKLYSSISSEAREAAHAIRQAPSLRELRKSLVALSNVSNNIVALMDSEEASLSGFRKGRNTAISMFERSAGLLNGMTVKADGHDEAVQRDLAAAVSAAKAVFDNGRVRFQQVSDDQIEQALEQLRDNMDLPTSLGNSLYRVVKAPVVPLFKNKAYSFSKELSALRLDVLVVGTYSILGDQALLAISRKQAQESFDNSVVRAKRGTLNRGVVIPPLFAKYFKDIGLKFGDSDSYDVLSMYSREAKGGNPGPKLMAVLEKAVREGRVSGEAEVLAAAALRKIEALIRLPKTERSTPDEELSPELHAARDILSKLNARSSMDFAFVSEKFVVVAGASDIAYFWLMPSAKAVKILANPQMKVENWAFPL